ncbi:MAG TPA: DNA topoisomerase IB [Actinomycetales bacterium]|nr:DNA topoisomerase IB [Actinomycetales bacterium]
MVRLRTVSPSQPGITRRRQGRGFVYLDGGQRVRDAVVIARIKDLVIPPAWQDVWICRYANGHIQAVGSDDKGRRQYLYHPVWREQRDRAKHDRVLEVAARLPRARQQVARDLALDGMPRARALATAFRLLDLGFFRIGGETYAEQNGSYGLATIERQHVSIEGDLIVFDYIAKSGKERYVAVGEPAVRSAVATLLRRRGGGPELLAYRDGKRWVDITSADINEYVKQVVGGEVSAKDFRTWHGTVLAAVALAVSTHVADTPTARRRAIARAMSEVATYLGNTPAVARASYVDPRVIDLFEDGITVEPALRRLGEGVSAGQPATHGVMERAVLRMLRTSPQAQARAARQRAVARRRRAA